MHHLPRLLLLAALATTPLHAQGVISYGTNGNCSCQANGKTWPCRQVRGDPTQGVLAVNRCNANSSFKLVCPEDPTAICHYDLVAPTCIEPPLTPVCYAGDEPK